MGILYSAASTIGSPGSAYAAFAVACLFVAALCFSIVGCCTVGHLRPGAQPHVLLLRGAQPRGTRAGQRSCTRLWYGQARHCYPHTCRLRSVKPTPARLAHKMPPLTCRSSLDPLIKELSKNEINLQRSLPPPIPPPQSRFRLWSRLWSRSTAAPVAVATALVLSGLYLGCTRVVLACDLHLCTRPPACCYGSILLRR